MFDFFTIENTFDWNKTIWNQTREGYISSVLKCIQSSVGGYMLSQHTFFQGVLIHYGYNYISVIVGYQIFKNDYGKDENHASQRLPFDDEFPQSFSYYQQNKTKTKLKKSNSVPNLRHMIEPKTQQEFFELNCLVWVQEPTELPLKLIQRCQALGVKTVTTPSAVSSTQKEDKKVFKVESKKQL